VGGGLDSGFTPPPQDGGAQREQGRADAADPKESARCPKRAGLLWCAFIHNGSTLASQSVPGL
jgi:hypothetical protein